jgi:hypothetical protein
MDTTPIEDELAAMEHALRTLGRLPQSSALDPEGLKVVLSPREEGLADKEVPVDALFKKLISVRDKLRVCEQRVNASKLSSKEKVALEARITIAYNAVATFLAFFSEDSLGAESDPNGEDA